MRLVHLLFHNWILGLLVLLHGTYITFFLSALLGLGAVALLPLAAVSKVAQPLPAIRPT